MSVCGETLSAITGMEEACATARARVEDLVAEADDLRRCLSQVITQRDSFKRQLATLQDAIVLALVQRIEPRMSRHPVTVVQHAGSIIARIGEAMVCQFEDGDDLVEAAKELVRERDEARAELATLRKDYDSVLEANVGLLDDAPWADVRRSYIRGAEAMREACARWMSEREGISQWVYDDALSALPIPEEP